MMILAKTVGAIALVGCALAPVAYLMGSLSLEACKGVLLVSTLAWFAASLLVNFSEAKASA